MSHVSSSINRHTRPLSSGPGTESLHSNSSLSRGTGSDSYSRNLRNTPRVGHRDHLEHRNTVSEPSIEHLAHYRENRNSKTWNSIELDKIIVQLPSAPGTDASHGIKKKHSKGDKKITFIETIGRAAPMIELVSKAMVPYLLLNHFGLDTSSKKLEPLRNAVRLAYVQFNRKLPESVWNQLGIWLKSGYFKNEFIKYFRDKRCDQIKEVWLKIFYEQPYKFIRHSLSYRYFGGQESNTIFPCISVPKSIFGIIHW